MEAEKFEGLTLLRRAGQCAGGWADVCRDPAGEEVIRLCILRPGLQKRLLWETPARLPARMEGGRLEILLPLARGQTFAEWLYACQPDLGQRRDVCLRLMEEILTHPVSPALLALSARPENLRLGRDTVQLAWFPRLEPWKTGQDGRNAVQAASRLMAEILTRGYGTWERYRFPLELKLVLLRADTGAYPDWLSLQQDLAALPDDLDPPGRRLRLAAARVQRLIQQMGGPAVQILVGLLVAAALLTLVQTAQARLTGWQEDWPGMDQIWEQRLGEEEAE